MAPMRSSESLFDRLPEETLLLVLQKLPFNTLVRCTSLSKYFGSLIRSPSFIYSSDANISVDNGFPVVVYCHPHYPKIRCTFSFGIRGWKEDSPTSSTFGIKVEDTPNVQVIGSCNGLICLGERSSSRVLLWNPLIRKSFFLPEAGPVPYFSCLGLGFSTKDNDYKVLMVAYNRQGGRTLQLYSLKLNSWRTIGSSALDSAPTVVSACNAPAVFACGSLHYAEANYHADKGFSSSIVVFDLENEALRSIALPEGLRARSAAAKRLSIVEYNGGASIAVIGEGVTPYYSLKDVWVMKDYGMEDSWLKLSTQDFVYIPRIPKLRINDRLWINARGQWYHAIWYKIDHAGNFSYTNPHHTPDDYSNKPLLFNHECDNFFTCVFSLALLDKENAV